MYFFAVPDNPSIVPSVTTTSADWGGPGVGPHNQNLFFHNIKPNTTIYVYWELAPGTAGVDPSLRTARPDLLTWAGGLGNFVSRTDAWSAPGNPTGTQELTATAPSWATGSGGYYLPIAVTANAAYPFV